MQASQRRRSCSSFEDTHSQIKEPAADALKLYQKLRNNQVLKAENKSRFFEGQLDSLLHQNAELKEKLTLTTKVLVRTTDVLRELLPPPGDPAARFQLQMAGIEAVSQVIKKDWHFMQGELGRLQNRNQANEIKILQIESAFRVAVQSYQAKIAEIIVENRRQVEQLQCREQKLTAQIEQITRNATEREQKLTAENSQKQHNHNKAYKQLKKLNIALEQALLKSQHEVLCLEQEIKTNLEEYQQSRELLIQNYRVRAEQAESELRAGYEGYIRLKKQQHEKEAREMGELLRQRCGEVEARDRRIGNLEQYIMKNGREIEDLTASLAAKEAELAGQASIIRQLHSQIQALRQNQKVQASQLLNVTNQFEQAQLQIKSLGKTIAHHRHRQLELQQDLAAAKDKLKQVQAASEAREHEIGQERGELQQQLEQLGLQLKLSHRQQDQQLTELEAARRQEKEGLMRDLQGERDKYTAIIQEITQERVLEKAKAEQQMQELSSRLNKQLQAEANNSRLLELQLKQQHEVSITRLLAQIEQVQQQKTAMEGTINELNQQLERLKLKQSQLSRALEQQQTAWALKLRESEQVWQEQVNKLSTAHDEAENEYRAMMSRQEAKHQAHLHSIQEQLNQKIGTLQHQISQLGNSRLVDELESRHTTVLANLEAEHRRTHARLQQAHATAMDELRQTYQLTRREQSQAHLGEIRQLRGEYEQTNRRDRQKAEKSMKQSQDRVQQIQQQLLRALQKHASQIRRGQQQKRNLAALNEELQAQHQCDRETLAALKKSIAEKEAQISNMDILTSSKLAATAEYYEGCMAKLRSTHAEAILEMRRRYEEEAKASMVDRLNFTNTMQQQFKQLRHLHEMETSSLSQKYNELEKLFQERPSRQEDIIRISELTRLKQQMDSQADDYRKTIQTANQAIKYLNLKFQNYQEIYDIFGPEDGKNYNQDRINENIGAMVKALNSKRRPGKKLRSEVSNNEGSMESNQFRKMSNVFSMNPDKAESIQISPKRVLSLMKIPAHLGNESQEIQRGNKNMSGNEQSEERAGQRNRRYSRIIPKHGRKLSHSLNKITLQEVRNQPPEHLAQQLQTNVQSLLELLHSGHKNTAAHPAHHDGLYRRRKSQLRQYPTLETSKMLKQRLLTLQY